MITNPWEELCLDLVGPYTIRGKEGSEIDFMCLTMINPASSWFKIVELPVVAYSHTETDRNTQDVGRTEDRTQEALGKTKQAYFDKSSFMISTLVNQCSFSRYPRAST